MLRNSRVAVVRQADTDFFLEGQDPDRLPDAVQGDTGGMGFLGFGEHAVEAGKGGEAPAVMVGRLR